MLYYFINTDSNNKILFKVNGVSNVTCGHDPVTYSKIRAVLHQAEVIKIQNTDDIEFVLNMALALCRDYVEQPLFKNRYILREGSKYDEIKIHDTPDYEIETFNFDSDEAAQLYFEVIN